jgi:hypothetical protein
MLMDLEMCVDEHNLLQRRLGCFLHVHQDRGPSAALVSFLN